MVVVVEVAMELVLEVPLDPNESPPDDEGCAPFIYLLSKHFPSTPLYPDLQNWHLSLLS